MAKAARARKQLDSYEQLIRKRRNRHRYFVKRAQLAIAMCQQLGLGPALSKKHNLLELGEELLDQIEKNTF